MGMPLIRLTPGMLDVLGGVDSERYKKFAARCHQIHECLRRHVSLFFNILMVLSDADPPIASGDAFSSSYLENELSKRFLPGCSKSEAEEALNNWLQTSAQALMPRLNDLVHDKFHGVGITSVATTTVSTASSLLGSATSLLSTAMGYIRSTPTK
jgi:hypothetical protein